MDILNSIPCMDDFSDDKLEDLVVCDRFFNLVQNKLEDPNQTNPSGYYTLLHVAAISTKNNSRVVQLLIDRGADVNSTTPSKETPLHFALCSRNRAAVMILIEAGASINSADYLQRTALHFVIDAGRAHASTPDNYVECDLLTLKRLLSHPDTDLNPVDHKGDTPLMWAVRRRQSTVVSALLKKGANPNIPNYVKQTPLHESLSGPNPSQDIVFKLLSNGAGIYGANKLRQTPVDILLSNVVDDETHLFAERCVKLIAFRYRIKEGLKSRLAGYPLLSQRLERCSEEVSRMRQRVIYDNVTIHDFASGCFHGRLTQQIYRQLRQIFLYGSYTEYEQLIECGMSDRLDRIAITRDYPEFENLIS